jgi:hypothetical protein
MFNLYGRNSIKEWCRANKGHRFLEMPTTSCYKYTDFLLLECLTPEDKLLYNRFKKSKKGMGKEDIKR